VRFNDLWQPKIGRAKVYCDFPRLYSNSVVDLNAVSAKAQDNEFEVGATKREPIDRRLDLAKWGFDASGTALITRVAE